MPYPWIDDERRKEMLNAGRDGHQWRRTLGTDAAAGNTLGGMFSRALGYRPMPPAQLPDEQLPERPTPSELDRLAYPDFHARSKLRLPPEEFMAVPVTDIEREILGLAPQGMLHDLNKQGLDRELNLMQLFHSLQRGKPKAM